MAYDIERPSSAPDGLLTRGDLLRRSVATGVGLSASSLLLSPFLAGCGGSDEEAAEGGCDPKTVTIVGWGGASSEAQTKAWYDPYQKQHKCEVKFTETGPPDYAKLRAMVESDRVTWDLVDATEDFGLESTGHLLEPIDYSIVNREALGRFAGKWRVGASIYGNVLAFRTDKFSDGPPQTWADFFDLDRFPGKRGIWQYPYGGVLEFALIADGADPFGLYPLDLDRAFRKLDTIKSDIVWWESGAEHVALLQSGEVTAAHAWNGRVSELQRADVTVEFTWQQAILGIDYWVIPKGSPNAKQAMNFLAWQSQPENAARIASFIEYSVANEEAPQHIPSNRQRLVPPLNPDNDPAGTLLFDNEWYDDNIAMVTERFQEWLLS